MASLADVLFSGEGIERPFRCHMHDDHSASASVNVLKMVWCCYACGANGTVDGKKTPSVADLESMLKPEEACRVYAESYLELFDRHAGNWAERFPEWLRWNVQLGCDPLTGDATFPVRTPHGKLAGVGRRKADPGDGPRYVYPPRWSAARSMFFAGDPHEILVLVEGAGDSAGVAETGAFAAGCYGSGLHKPQIDLIMRRNPKLVLIATDADDAGRSGAERAAEALVGLVQTVFVDWSYAGGKDPLELPMKERRELLAETVVGASYGQRQDIAAVWTTRATLMQARYASHVEENA